MTRLKLFGEALLRQGGRDETHKTVWTLDDTKENFNGIRGIYHVFRRIKA